MSATSADEFLRALPAWAGARADVLAVGLVGSHARGEASPDSDVDLVILTETPRAYVDDTSWARGFGEVERLTVEHYGRLTSVRVFYATGPEVEFGFTSPAWASRPTGPGEAEVVASGLRVIFERRELLTPLALDAFFTGYGDSRPLFEAVRALVDDVGGGEMRVSKTQISFTRRRGFAWAWIPERALKRAAAPLVLSVSLPSRDPSPRWKQVVEPAPGRFMHHLEVHDASEVDDEVRDWLQAAADFGS
jgi:predicted nucleotidyltransferase